MRFTTTDARFNDDIASPRAAVCRKPKAASRCEPASRARQRFTDRRSDIDSNRCEPHLHFHRLRARECGQGYHWNTNAETYYLIGDAMGKAVLGLLDSK